jgi:hypothetical protein
MLAESAAAYPTSRPTKPSARSNPFGEGRVVGGLGM